MALPSHQYLHGHLLNYYTQEETRYSAETRRVPSRIDQLANQLRTLKLRQGDALVAKVKECFHHGLGVKWGDNQIKIFNAFLAACLPFIYGETWPEEKARVFREWGLERERMYCLVNMARRNGKTFVTAGTTAALLLCVPNMKIAIFSTCKRTSQMMLTAATDMIEKAFELGTHADRQDFTVVTKNMESIIFEGPDRTKRQLGSFPGSVRVSERVVVVVVVASISGTWTFEVDQINTHMVESSVCVR